MPYLDPTAFKSLTLAPASYADDIEAREPGWLTAKLTALSGWIDSRLRKRYAAPFAIPYPDAVRDWLERLATYEVYIKRGIDPSDQQMIDVKDRYLTARDEIKEAAESRDGLFDLPVQASTATGISKGAPLMYSEASPYTTWKLQLEAAQDE